jgi:uncharacterized membrane protein YgcG
MIALLAQIQDLAKDPKDIFGKVEITTGPTSLYNQPVSESIATIFVFFIQFAFVVGGILVLVYMLWGALDYITSGGDPDRAGQARQKIINALIGIIVLVMVLAIWLFITDIFGIIRKTEHGFRFNLPTLGKDGTSGNSGGSSGGSSGGTTPCDNPIPRKPKPC